MEERETAERPGPRRSLSDCETDALLCDQPLKGVNMAAKIFLNLPVKNLDKSIESFTRLGFTFNAQFTDKIATSMIVSEDIGLPPKWAFRPKSPLSPAPRPASDLRPRGALPFRYSWGEGC
jgi:hypothetical protein